MPPRAAMDRGSRATGRSGTASGFHRGRELEIDWRRSGLTSPDALASPDVGAAVHSPEQSKFAHRQPGDLSEPVGHVAVSGVVPVVQNSKVARTEAVGRRVGRQMGQSHVRPLLVGSPK